jgi:hypothetical protein
MKDTLVPCVSIKLLPSNKQLVVLEKAATTATSPAPSGTGQVVNPPDISISMVADQTDNYSVGKSYKVSIQLN